MARLGSKQERLIMGLLIEDTIAGAAAIAGVGETTAHRWLKDLAFQAAYEEAKHTYRAEYATALAQLETRELVTQQ